MIASASHAIFRECEYQADLVTKEKEELSIGQPAPLGQIPNAETVVRTMGDEAERICRLVRAETRMQA